MQINTGRNANELKRARRSGSTSGHQTRKLLLLGVANLLVGINIWAQVVAPNGLYASSVCSNSVTLKWVDPNTNSVEQSVLVLKSTRSSNKGYTTVATLPAYTTTYTDTGVVGSKTYYYRISILNSNGRKYTSNPIAVTTSAPLTVSPSSSDVPDIGGSTNALVIDGSGCGWTASSTDTWITVDSVNTGFGTGTVTYSVAPNTSTSSRTGSVTVANQTIKVTQNSSSACTYLASPANANIVADSGSGSFTVTPSKNGNACSWTATPTSDWIHTTSSGSGIGMASYTVDPNTGTSPRTGTITVTDNAGGPVATYYTLTQAGLPPPPPSLTITTASPLPVATAGVAYSQTFTASGGTTPYSWSIGAGSLPAGLTLSSGGVLSGTPTTATTANFTVQCTGGSTTTQAFSLTVNPAALTITTVSPLPAATAGVAYNQTFTASGGTTPYSWSISAGSLPTGLTLSSGGVLSGTPTTVATANFTVQCTGGSTTTQAFSLTVNPAALTITTASPLPAATAGVAYSQTLAASGGTTPYSWSVSAGSLPSGLTLSSGGVLSGTPTTATTANFTVQCTGGSTATRAFSLTVSPAALTITTVSPLPAATAGVAYSQTLAASGGTTPYSWSISAGSLPAGLTLSSGGVLSGTPTTATTANFIVQCTGGSTTSKAFSLTVNPAALTIATASPLPVATAGVAYSQTLTASGGTTPYSWSISAGSLPAGLTLSSGGVLSGTPTTAATANFTVQCTGGSTTTQAFSLTVNPAALTITTTSPLPAATAGVAYSQTLAASGGTTPYSWSVSAGSLPAGLTLSSGGMLSGTPTTAATANFTVQCTGGSTATQAFSLTVNPAALTITTASPLPAATVGVVYSGTFTGSGGTTPYSWSVSAGSLPAGLTLSSGGVLSGTPTTATTASFTVQCTGGSTTTKAFSLTVNPAAINYTVTTSANPSNAGTTSPNASFSNGTTVTAQATVNTGFSFVNWTQNGATVSTSPSYSFQLNMNVTLVANFTPVYTITGTASPSNGGTIAGLGNGEFTSGTPISLTANPATGYSFSNWTESGSVVSSTPTYNFTATANRGLVANFSSTASPPATNAWAIDIGSTGADVGYSVASDASGNLFVAGYFDGSVNFGGGTLTSAGGQDIFVAKYSPSGAYLWATRIGGTANDEALSIAVDPRSGDVAVTGYFQNSVTFGANTYTSAGGKDVFLAKLSGVNGAVQWSRQISGHSTIFADDTGNGVAIDPNNGDVVVVGTVAAYTDFGGGLVFTTASSIDSFVARYSSSGTYLWAKHSNCISGDYAESVAVDTAGNVLVAGWDAGAIDWGGGLLSFLGSGANSYVVKLTSSGTYVWSQSFGALTGNATIYSLAVNSSGDVAISGTFLGTMNFGSGIAPIVSMANNAAFTVKLSGASGSALWAKAFVPSGNSMAGVYSAGNAVAFDASGNVVVTGDFLPACDFGGGLFTSAGSMDGFVAKYNGSGTHLWSQKFGGTGWDGGFGVTVDKTGNPIVTGATSGGTFNGTTLPSAGGNDIFLMKLAP